MTAWRGIYPAFVHPGLGRRFLVVLLASMTLGSLAFLAVFVGIYRERLIHEHARASAQVNGLLQAALENAMLKRDLPGLRAIVEALGRQDDIADVMILNPQGEIRFASDGGLVGTQFAGAPPAGTQRTDLLQAMAEFIPGRGGQEVLRTINPVRNREACRGCHGDAADRPVNGVLVVDYHASKVKSETLASGVAMAASGGVVTLLALLSIGVVLYRHVLSPVGSLVGVTTALTGGDLTPRYRGSGDDEISTLGRCFNAMADRLSQLIDGLRASTQTLQSVIDAMPDGVRVIADDYKIVMANRSYCAQQRVAAADVVGQTCHWSSHRLAEPCSPTLVLCPLVELSKAGKTAVKCRHRHLTSDGRETFVEVSAARVELHVAGLRRTCIVESIRDLAEQARFSHEQRLSEVGQLATGVAHEIHNPLSSIHLALRAMREDILKTSPSSNIEEYLSIADREINRCIEITGRLLRLSEPPGANAVLVEMDRIVRDVVSLLAHQAAQAGVEVDIETVGNPRVIAAESDIGIIALNLIDNALHAMPHGGRLSIRIADEAGEVVLRVADSGVGIAREDLPKVFWPFWSKRADGGHGTGLGLSICKTTIERLKGRIAVDSEVGRGTRFAVTLPGAERTSEVS